MATTPQYNFTINRQDLDFILKQIKIAEVSTLPNGDVNRQALLDAIGGPGAQVSSVALLPYGLRTVDGTWNHLLPGQERAGAADNLMPRLVPANLNVAGSGSLDLDGPGPAAATVGSTTNYNQNSGPVVDAHPRLISNLIVDQTINNPAAVAADLERLGVLGDKDPITVIRADGTPGGQTLVIPNLSPDIGLSPPFNSWMTFFGQFFDHGLDLIDKGQSGTVYIPLQPDDPLYVAGGPSNFMVLTRATNQPGPDGIIGTADDIHDHRNTTTPFVDQNQTYTSHPSHQVFLREYTTVADGADAGTFPDVFATGRLLRHQIPNPTPGADPITTGEGTWLDVKNQAASVLGIRLVDTDVLDCPLLATDRYGEFIRGANGLPQMVVVDNTTGLTRLVEGNTTTPVLTSVAGPGGYKAVPTGHAFLVDIAHNAVPGTTFDTDGNPATPGTSVVGPDGDALTGNAIALDFAGHKVAYDDELLNAHFVTGDGRGNENIGLTTVHTIFHSEHNRLVGDYKNTIISGGDRAFALEWLRPEAAAALPAVLPTTPAGVDSLIRALDAAGAWDGERLFQAGRFATEMQYQHLVFEEFARGVSPTINPFVFSNSADLNPAIVAEFANVVYRFGHSMLTETVNRIAADGQTSSDIGLIQAFLNPLQFNNNHALSEAESVGRIVRGTTRDVGNEIDEFIVDALRNNLVGLPLDLSVLNMTRARDTGMPTFNEARAQFFAMTGDAQLKPFTSWADMAPHLKHSASIVNFIAAYGLHPSIVAETTTDGKRAAAMALVMNQPQLNVVLDVSAGPDGILNDNPGTVVNEAADNVTITKSFAVPLDRAAFLNSTGAWNAGNSGLNKVDFWIGGLAEFVNEFQGMLGPTFNFVFETQLENLQNGDRFYYLSRTQGTNMINQLENNTFSKLIMRNSDLGVDSTHLASLVFQTPNYILEVNQARQNNASLANGPGPDGILVDNPLTPVNEAADNTTANSDPFGDDPILEAISPMVQRGPNFLSFAGGDHVVLGGTINADTLRGGKGIDSLWGDQGNDNLDGGDEADQVHGGDGNDIITDHGTPAGGADFLHGDDGNDVINGGTGLDLLFGGRGKDFIMTGDDGSEIFAGEGDDFLLGGAGTDNLMGNEGNDWIEGGEGLETLTGENSELFFNSPIIGHDVLNGQGNDTDYDGESGDDIMVEGPGIQRNNGMLGFDWGIHKGDPVGADSDLGIPFFPGQAVFTLRDRFDSVEGLSGWKFDDKLTGVSFPVGAVGAAVGIIGAPATDSKLLAQNVDLISGFRALLGLPLAGSLGAVDTVPQVVIPGLGTVPGVTPVDVIDPNTGGDIILGGGGSDIIYGKAGNDFIDGNAWLNVRISFLKSAVTGVVPFATDPADATRYTVEGLAELKPYMLAGRIDPGALNIVREIVTEPTVAGERDVALFAGAGGVFTNPLTNLPSTQLGAGAGAQLVGAGFTITRQTVGAGGVILVTDTDTGTAVFVPPGVAADPLLRDEGTDRLRNIEVARFTNADGSFTDITLNAVNINVPATGAPAIADTSPGNPSIAPTQTLTLTASIGTIADANGIASPLAFQWQTFNGTTWANVPAGGGSNTASYTPQDIITEGILNQPLRVQVTFTDSLGNVEVVNSAQTDPLGNFSNLITGTAAFNGTAGADVLTALNIGIGTVDNNLINGLAGDDVINGGNGNDTLNGGDGADTLNGGANTDILNGGNGNDTMLGGGGTDTLTGGAGVDTMTGNGGADVFVFGDALDGTILHTGIGAARDIITDFVTGSDRIDLSLIDANLLLAGNQAFTLTAGGGTGAFTGAGQLRGFIEAGTGHLILEGNLDANLAADFQIQLNNPANFNPALDLIA